MHTQRTRRTMQTAILCALVVTAVTTSTLPDSQPFSTDYGRVGNGHSEPLPLLIWHGLGDSYDADGISATAELAKHVNPGTFVYPIRLSDDGSDDRRAGFFGNVTAQLAQVCDDIASHPVLSQASAVNALGFSQGGQFLRAYIERCNNPPVQNLVTFGSQHNGISEFQECGSSDWLCKGVQGLLRSNTWSNFVQNSLVPAQYFRDPDDLASYLEYSNFLADINNERKQKNATYRKNLSSIEKLVMYVFEDDETVHPKETGWFAEVNGTTGEITPLRNRTIYKEDWLGLKKLDDKNGLVFKTTPGRHMQLDDLVLKEAFETYFAPKDASPEAPAVPDQTGETSMEPETQIREDL